MLYLIIAILTSTTIMIVFKLSKKYEINILQAITVNYLVAAGFGFAICEKPLSLEMIKNADWFYISFFTGITFIVGFNLFALSAQKAGVAITAVASKMSVVIPVILGFTIFSEKPTILKLFGIIFTLCAFYLIFKKEKGFKIDYRYVILPLLLFLANGANDSLLKYTQHNYIANDNDFIVFLAFIFFIALIIGSFVMGINIAFTKTRISTKSIGVGVLLGVLNWYSTLFFLKALNVIDVSVVVPILNVSIVALSAIVGYFVFKEQLRKINWIGILLALLAILSIAFAK